MERYIGLMSGTSADGVDAVVALFEGSKFSGIEASWHLAHSDNLRTALIALGRDANASVTLAQLATLDVAIAEQFATATHLVLSKAGRRSDEISAIGSHGQTIFHDPKHLRSSLQLGDPNHIAALTGIPVAADFRRMDVALGGEGAPLVPAFHKAVFSSEASTAVINIGGIANVTLLPASQQGDVTGYDCGPGNGLMDEWAMRHLGKPYDAEGAFAASGRVLEGLLAAWLAAPYFALPPPKSTGRAQFNLHWAEQLASTSLATLAAEDVQATLCELTARSLCDTVPLDTRRVLICGGGAFNTHLMGRIAAHLPAAKVSSTAVAGLPPQWVEAAAFAWLAHQRVHQLPGNLVSVTGARRPAVLGGLYSSN